MTLVYIINCSVGRYPIRLVNSDKLKRTAKRQ